MIELNGKEYQICLFDTNALSNFLKSPKKWIECYDKKFSIASTIIAYSIFSIVEIAESSFLYNKYLEIFSIYPSFILDGFFSIFIKELNAYDKDNYQVNPIVISPLHSGLESKLNPKERLKTIIEKSEFFNRKRYWDSGRQSILDGITSLTKNYPPKNNKYSKKEIENFVDLATLQQIIFRDKEFVQKRVNNKYPIDPQKFPSIISTSFVVFFKFYPDKRKPTISDVYDILISSLLLYVDYVITENNLCEIIRKIQENHSFLNKLKYYSINDVIKKI